MQTFRWHEVGHVVAGPRTQVLHASNRLLISISLFEFWREIFFGNIKSESFLFRCPWWHEDLILLPQKFFCESKSSLTRDPCSVQSNAISTIIAAIKKARSYFSTFFPRSQKKDKWTWQWKIFCTFFSQALEANPEPSASKVGNNSVDEKSDVSNVKELAFGSLQKQTEFSFLSNFLSLLLLCIGAAFLRPQPSSITIRK